MENEIFLVSHFELFFFIKKNCFFPMKTTLVFIWGIIFLKILMIPWFSAKNSLPQTFQPAVSCIWPKHFFQFKPYLMIFDNTHRQNLLLFVSHFVLHIVAHSVLLWAPHFLAHFVCLLIFLEFHLSKEFGHFYAFEYPPFF